MSDTSLAQPVHVLLDTNVVLDLVIEREPWLTQAQPMWSAWDARKLRFSIPTVSLTTIAYIAHKPLGYQGVMEALRWCVSNLNLLNTTQRDIKAALKMTGPDFEDNVQIACAMRAHVSFIVTRNPRDFTASAIRVVNPVELMDAL